MSLQKLNFECLEHVFKNLTLEEQFKVRQVGCAHFNKVITSIWRRTTKVVCLHYDTDSTQAIVRSPNDCLINAPRYTDYMTSISNNVESLFLNDVAQINCLAGLTLPAVKNLMLSVREDFEKTIIFAKMFPALEHLDVVWDDASSDDVDFKYADPDPPRWKLRKCIFALPLSVTLREVSLDEDLMALVIKPLVTRLPRLRRIRAIHGTCTPKILLPQIARMWPQAEKVHTLDFNFIWSGFKEHLAVITRFTGIRTLNFVAGCDTLHRYPAQVETMLTDLKQLRVVHYRVDYDTLEYTYDDNVDLNAVRRAYIYDFIIFVVGVLEQFRRDTPLEVHCYGSRLKEYLPFQNIIIPDKLDLHMHDYRSKNCPCVSAISFQLTAD